jgi:hypothetical protein
VPETTRQAYAVPLEQLAAALADYPRSRRATSGRSGAAAKSPCTAVARGRVPCGRRRARQPAAASAASFAASRSLPGADPPGRRRITAYSAPPVWVDVLCRSRRSGFCPCGAGEPTTPAGETCPGQAATRSARAPSLDRRRWRPGRRGRTFGVRRKERTLSRPAACTPREVSGTGPRGRTGAARTGQGQPWTRRALPGPGTAAERGRGRGNRSGNV